jgi:hypothetical protein
MEYLDPTDQGTPIEEYPGFVGYTWDGEFYPGDELKVLKDFDWRTYHELLEEYDQPRRLILRSLPQPIECEIQPYADLAYLLDQVPSVRVMRDDGPPDAGPASGSGYVFFIADGVSVQQLGQEIASLRHALDADLRELSAGSTLR